MFIAGLSRFLANNSGAADAVARHENREVFAIVRIQKPGAGRLPLAQGLIVPENDFQTCFIGMGHGFSPLFVL
jgi:hypothetical protein